MVSLACAGRQAGRPKSPAFWDSAIAPFYATLVGMSTTNMSPENRAQAVTTEHPTVDVRDMLVVHTALLREFRLAPATVTRVPPGARRQVAAVDRHLGFLCDLLHHHHTGEDKHLWPSLRTRVPDSALPLLDEAEAQHAGIEEALQRVTAARRRWARQPDAANRDELAGALRRLHALLAEHLDAEERRLLPLAAAHLSEREWMAIGESAVASLPKSALPLLFGMFAYEGDPGVLADMLKSAPPPVRLIVPRIAPAIYARRAARVHGTPRP